MPRILALAFIFALVIQERPAPPEGWFCENKPKADAEHKCECQRLCTVHQDGSRTVTEDPKCKVFCHAKSCKCLSLSCDTEM